MRYRKLLRLYSGKEKTACCAIFKLVIMFHSAHGIRVKLVTKHVIYLKLARKRISVLTGLKLSSMTCKCIFCRPELNAKGGPHGIEF